MKKYGIKDRIPHIPKQPSSDPWLSWREGYFDECGINPFLSLICLYLRHNWPPCKTRGVCKQCICYCCLTQGQVTCYCEEFIRATTHMSIKRHDSPFCISLQWHQMWVIASRIIGTQTVCSTNFQANIKENTKVHITGPLWGESIGRRSVDSPHKGPVMRREIPCHDVIITGPRYQQAARRTRFLSAF